MKIIPTVFGVSLLASMSLGQADVLDRARAAGDKLIDPNNGSKVTEQIIVAPRNLTIETLCAGIVAQNAGGRMNLNQSFEGQLNINCN